MTGRRFDDLARVVARSVPRRTVFKGAIGALGAGVVRLVRGGKPAAAQSRPSCGRPGTGLPTECPGTYGFDTCCIAVFSNVGICCQDPEVCDPPNGIICYRP
jgi:hypothetical protein